MRIPHRKIASTRSRNDVSGWRAVQRSSVFGCPHQRINWTSSGTIQNGSTKSCSETACWTVFHGFRYAHLRSVLYGGLKRRPISSVSLKHPFVQIKCHGASKVYICVWITMLIRRLVLLIVLIFRRKIHSHYSLSLSIVNDLSVSNFSWLGFFFELERV